ncbi:L,D-transpeptidase family protein [Pedobacter sp. N36a]|uniref:L,D-transpeptidase family protein n=1 Tax=Pedobacter sp. N36a TaxID=2767996 RepID=UPI001656BC08|nr:L,D-transpeptidase family protein [Pedobacter sp. N36a]MBC8986974.1 L,D-transpeptidase family protein [Pedobacter sp. N36a]
MVEKYGQDQQGIVNSELQKSRLQQENRLQQESLKLRNDSARVFKQLLEANRQLTDHPQWLDSIYHHHLYKPFLITQPGKAPLEIVEYLRKSVLHGLDTNYFYLNAIGPLVREMKQQELGSPALKYREQLKLEMLMASALLKYSEAMQYGMIRPDSLDKNYFITTQAPDRSKIMTVFDTPDLLAFLDSIQPSSAAYLALQKALKTGKGTINRNKEDAAMTIKLNMERLRWKNQPDAQKYVWVNIPDFTLNVIEKGRSTLEMKVCVGEGRTDTDTGTKETPQLNSMIYSVQVNPIWNIPASIARKEISKYANNDPYYLSNNDIDVYKAGKRISSPERIDWANADISQFTFKQRPGEQNSLGKIKFIFNNNSSVYLHDTPARSAFKKKGRAISHGCVRVEKPMELALALFGPGKTFDQIKRAMERSYPRAKYIGLPAKVPVYLTYITAWVDDQHILQIRNDIYGLDDLLYKEMKAREIIAE